MRERVRLELEGRVALVSGGGRGIGRAIAQALAKEGAKVAVLARSEDELMVTKGMIEEEGGEALALQADVTVREEVQKAVREAEEQFGMVDILVNNAGRHHAIGPLWEVDPEDWWLDIESNLRSTFLCAHTVLPQMIQQRRGCIINISSGAGNEPRPYSTAYSSVKAAVTRLSASLALSTREFGVDVFAIHPGAVRTELAEYLLQSEAGRRWLPNFTQIYAEQEVAPELAGQMVVYLASGKATSLSGRFLSVKDNLDDLVQQANTIQKQDLLVLRLHKDGL